MRSLEYYRRWLGTAISFALFAIGGLLQGLIVHPLIRLFIRDLKRRRRISRRVVGASMGLFVWIMKTLGVLDYKITGREHIAPGKSYLVFANHPSLIDVIFLLSLFPEADCVVKESMVHNPLYHGLIKSADYISNSDPVTMLFRAVESVQRGDSLIIFPEGTRTQGGSKPVFQSGAAAIAVRAGQEFLPVFISCWPTTLTRADRWYQIPDHKVSFTAAIQAPVNVAPWIGNAESRRIATSKVSEQLESYFLAGISQNVEQRET